MTDWELNVAFGGSRLDLEPGNGNKRGFLVGLWIGGLCLVGGWCCLRLAKRQQILWDCGNFEGILSLFSFCFSVVFVFLDVDGGRQRGNEGMLGARLFCSYFVFIPLYRVHSHFRCIALTGMWIRWGSRWDEFCAIARRSERWFRCR